MITTFVHKGLKAFHESGSKKGIQSDHAAKLARILASLEIAEQPNDMDLSGFALHSLTGPMKGFWSVKVNGNWRVTFRFSGTNVEEIDYRDYH